MTLGRSLCPTRSFFKGLGEAVEGLGVAREGNPDLDGPSGF